MKPRQVLLFCGFVCAVISLTSTQNAVIDYDDPAQYNIPDAIGVCQSPWRPVLKLDALGDVAKGTVDEIRDLSLEGHLFRVKLLLPEGPYVLFVDNTNVRGDHVCAESLWHVSDNGTHVSTSVEWRYHLLCTNGHVEVINSPYSRPQGWVMASNAQAAERSQDAQQNFGTTENSTQAMVWYVKEIGKGKPVYSHYLDGSRVSGSMDDLMHMARLGETRCVMRDRGYAFAMNNVIVDKMLGEVNGQSLNHIGQEFTSNALSFREPPYYWLSSWTTDGRRDNSRWFVGTTQPRGHNNDYVALDWHVDSCWREVYVNDQYGFPISGSLDELIFLISLGHRVRCQYDNTVLEANAIRIKDQTVIAQSIEEMARRGSNGGDKYFFNTNTMAKWTTVHTTGTVRTYTYRVSDMSFYRKEKLQVSVRWMVDTRPWKRVYSTPPRPFDTNTINTLIDAVKRGASIRFNLQQDVVAGFFFTNGDNVRVDDATQTVYAQCLRHISDQRDTTTESEYEIQKNPFHWFLMISSDGVMAMSAWKTQARTRLYDSVAPEANITWFASF
ncbi:uncharacterized protein [Littorina saxatilis]|uniref:Uncharacterized protein n=1 Tax=Littorina saxatilis TaxID=31220 RepID=A0AAN9BF96_9CAEN